MRARLRNATKDVWQLAIYEPSAAPAWVRGCTQMRSDGLYLVRGAGGCDSQRVDRGDWLLRDLDGDTTWSNNRDFAKEYELVR